MKDRLIITSARWGLEGAEAILKLRAVIASVAIHATGASTSGSRHERIHHVIYSDGLVLAA